MATLNTANYRDVGNLSAIQMPDYDTEMHLLAPKDTSFTYLLKKLPKEKANGNYTFTCFEDEHVTPYITVNAATTASATAVTVDSTGGVRRNDIYRNERTGECILVEIVASTTSLNTIVRAFGSTGVTAGSEGYPMIDGDVLVRLGNAAFEGMGAGDYVHTTESTIVNYLQEFRESILLTDRAIRSKNYTGKDWPYQLEKSAKKFAMDMERQFLFGEGYSTTFASNGTTEVAGITTDAMPISATRGIIPFIKTYADSSRVWNVNGTLTVDDFIKKFLEPAFEFGSDNKILFASTKLMMAMGYWGWQKKDLKSGDKTLDLIFNKIDTPIGILTLVHHRQLDAPHAGANATVANGSYGIVLDMKAPLALKEEMPLTKNVLYEPYKNPSGYSARKEEFVRVCGLKAADLNRHALLYGIQSFA